VHPSLEDRRRAFTPDELARLRAALDDDVVALEASPLVGGIDTATYRLDARRRDGTVVRMTLHCYRAWERERAADRIARERALLDALAGQLHFIPGTIFVDPAGELVGDPLSVLTFLRGSPEPPPRGDQRARGRWIEDFARPLVAIHAIGADRLPAGFRRNDPLVPYVAGLAREARDDGVSRALLAAIRRTIPEEPVAPVLLHHDYWYGNTLWENGRLTGVIDWTSARLGDAATDVALARCDLAVTLDLRAADELVDRYRALGGSIRGLLFWDLCWALVTHRWIEEWLVGYHDLGLSDLTLAAARDRIAAFAERALRQEAAAR
jgi:aminoglycoside phosphotransferase (APT) family kinase protein